MKIVQRFRDNRVMEQNVEQIIVDIAKNYCKMALVSNVHHVMVLKIMLPQAWHVCVLHVQEDNLSLGQIALIVQIT